jgi:GrpB-like predicted nucleotidyltransferase (UPF0157 family)
MLRKSRVQNTQALSVVFSSGCPEIERVVMFRDWLREIVADRDLYTRTKRELARKEWKYVQNYVDAKTGIIEQIMGLASRRQKPQV